MRSAALLASAAALALAACAAPVPAALPAAPPPRAPVLLQEAPPVAPEVPAESAALEPPVDLRPGSIGRPGEVACTWGTLRWRSSGSPTELRLQRDGPVFALITGGRAQVQLAVGKRQEAFMDVASSGLVLSGVVESAQISLFATNELAMNGVVYPASTAPLSLVQGFTGAVSVTMETPHGVTVSKPPLMAKRQCADMALDRGTALNLAQAALGAANGTIQVTKGKEPLSLASEPGRAPEIRVDLMEGSIIETFATRGSYSRIGIGIDNALLAGWIKTERLQSATGGVTGTIGNGSGSTGVRDPVLKPIMRRTCAADVPLIAEAGDERLTVGHVVALTPMNVIERKGPFFRVAVISRDIHPTLTGALLVRASDLNGCHEQ